MKLPDPGREVLVDAAHAAADVEHDLAAAQVAAEQVRVALPGALELLGLAPVRIASCASVTAQRFQALL